MATKKEKMNKTGKRESLLDKVSLKSKSKKVFKYGTGDEIPKGAVYLCTKVQRKIKAIPEAPNVQWVKCWLVWHYFLVELKG